MEKGKRKNVLISEIVDFVKMCLPRYYKYNIQIYFSESIHSEMPSTIGRCSRVRVTLQSRHIVIMKSTQLTNLSKFIDNV